MRGFDVVIGGNGALGLMSAWRLILDDPALRVAVVGPVARTGGGTQASGAMLGSFGEVTTATLASEPARQKFALARAAHQRWPQVLAQLAEHGPLPQVSGTHVLLNGRSGDLDSANFAAVVHALREFAEPYSEVDDVPGLYPLPDARPLRALHLPQEGAVDSAALLRALEAACTAGGVTLLDDTVEQVETTADGVSGVRLGSGEQLATGQVVLALGAFTTPVLRRTGGFDTVQPVLAGAGLAYMTERVMGAGFDGVVRTVNRAGSCGLHVIPFGGGREYAGATNVVFAEPELRAHLGVVHFVADCVIDQLDQLACYARIDEVRVGNRPVPFDTYPMLGPTSVAGLHIVTGTYRDGVHASPQIADWVSRSVRGGAGVFPAVFAPERRPHLHLTRAESVEQYTGQGIASAFEGRTVLSRFIASDDLAELYRPRAEAVHDRLGLTDAGLAPDIVGFLALSRKSEDDVTAIADYLARAGVTT